MEEDSKNWLHKTHRALIRNDLSTFISKCFDTVHAGQKYQHNWHIDTIAHYLEACEKGEIKRLIINIPPRYLKSLCVSVAWPAWLLGHNPSRRILVASYAKHLATKHSTDCRCIMEAGWYRSLFPNTAFTSDQNEKQKYVTTGRGYRFAVSTQGTVTGEGVIDAAIITEDDILAGKYDYAEIEIFILNYEDLTQGRLWLRRGWIGEVSMNRGQFVAEVREYLSGEIKLVLPLTHAIQVGDTYQIIAGCDKTFETCKEKFNNVVNFRGEPHVPGTDRMLETASTRSSQ